MLTKERPTPLTSSESSTRRVLTLWAKSWDIEAWRTASTRTRKEAMSKEAIYTGLRLTQRTWTETKKMKRMTTNSTTTARSTSRIAGR